MGIYKQRNVGKNQKEYVLKDQNIVLLNDSEIDLARKQMRIDVSGANSPYLKSIIDTSAVCYAIMAKRFPIEFPKLAKKTYEENLAYISDVSFDVRYGINLLGTGDYVIFLRRWSSIVGLNGVVVWSPGHTVFASDYKCDMRGNASNFSRGSKSYIRFWGRMYIDPNQTMPAP
jgi:hypothetical protein